MAEAAFAALYESSWRVIDSAWAIARLYRKYGPAPLGRPHLDRILDDREGRSASDIREVIDPASGMMEQLP